MANKARLFIPLFIHICFMWYGSQGIIEDTLLSCDTSFFPRMIGDPSLDFNVVSFDVDMNMNTVILGNTGSGLTSKSIVAYSTYSSPTFEWAYEY